MISPVMDESGVRACERWLDQASFEGLIIDVAAGTPFAPMSARQLCELAEELRSRDRILAAYICQQRAAELAPAEPQHWYALGELAHIVGRREEARHAYERYHAAHPEDAEVAHVLRALRDEPPPARASQKYIEQLYSRFAPFYDKNMCGELDYRAPQLLFDAITAKTGSRTNLNVLDMGCGTGLFGQQIRPRARSLIGVDLSPAMLEQATQRRIYDGVERADFCQWLGHDRADRFDVIAFCDSLIYFGDLNQLLPRAAERLLPGGVLAFTVEAGPIHPFALTDSGRFAHHRDYLAQVASACQLGVSSLTVQTLRYEYGRPVPGWVAVFNQSN